VPRALGAPPEPPAHAATVPAPPPQMMMSPGVSPDMSAMQNMMLGFYQRTMDEFFAARQEGRQPVMPPMPMPMPSPADEDARMAKVVAATITALSAAGVIPKPTEKAEPTPPPKDFLTMMAEREAENERFERVAKGMAKRMGFIPRDELPDVEVPAPTVEKSEEPEREDGQGMFDFMLQQMMGHIAKNPKAAFETIGKLLQNPAIGGFVKDLLVKQGIPLPSMQTTGVSMPNGAGFIPSP
jgi:hypothetical protein